jgi:hypothetical protein
MALASKRLFTSDYEFHASVKMLYPYLSTASGLSEWFADDVSVNNLDKTFTFSWDDEKHKANLAGHRTNHFVRFEFLPETEADKKDPSYFELRIDTNEMTQSTFLRVTDYSDFDDEGELRSLWDGLVGTLKSIVGG